MRTKGAREKIADIVYELNVDRDEVNKKVDEIFDALGFAPLVEKDWADTDDDLTEVINDAHPIETEDYELYTEAMRLIGNRHSKGSLVMLVNYLLRKIKLEEAK